MKYFKFALGLHFLVIFVNASFISSRGDGLISFGLRIHGEERYLFSDTYLNFTIEDCKSLELCPTDLKEDEFLDQVDSLNQLSFFKKALEKFEKELDMPFNTSTQVFSMSKDGISGDIPTHYPSYFHHDDKYRLIVVVPIFFICFITCVIMYFQKRKLLIAYNFKFSNLSLILIKYLMAKLSFTVFYLIHLVLFVDFGFKSLGATGILIALSAINYIFSLATFTLVTLFAFGYCTAFFSMNNRRHILLKSGGLIALYGIQTAPRFFMEIQQIVHAYHHKFFVALNSTSLTVGSIVLFIFIIGITSSVAYGTYRKLLHEDPRYLISCLIIMVAYILNPFIVVPRGGRDILEFIKNKYISSAEIWASSGASGIHVPEIIELFVISILIFIWRDQKYVENDEKEYSVLSASY